jgi:uncharacterized protein (TIGR03118 family)
MFRAKQRPTSRFSVKPRIESLEGRCLMAGNVLQTNLVSDLPGVAQVLDPNLVNPWGISESSGSPFWISDNNAGVSTLYNVPGTDGSPVSINPLVVSIPTPDNPTGATGAPTGTVFNIDGGPSGGFVISGVDRNGNPNSASAVFLFATEDGTIVGWNPNVNPAGFDMTKAGTFGTIAVDNSQVPDAANGAVYKGLAIATDPNTGQTLLYAANFRSGQIDVFDTSFNAATLPDGAFTDPNLPNGYAPFNVQELGGKIYVTYAKQNADMHDDVAGAGHGFVDVFNLDGTPGLADGNMRLVSRGPLNSPWGLAIAPDSFGKFGGALLVGNFGNGKINAFDPNTGAFLGQLKDPDGEPIQIDGLWALKVGNGGSGGDANSVYFTAGLDHEMHGLFGSLSPVAKGTPEGLAEEQAVVAALDVFQISLNTLQNDMSSGASADQIAMDVQNLDNARAALVQAEMSFAADAGRDQDPPGHHHHGGGGAESVLEEVFAALSHHRHDFD